MDIENPDLKINPTSLRDEVYNLMRERILTNHYSPNFRFDLPLLEDQFGISRTPIKEALQKLEAEGLVEIRPRRGTFVAGHDPRDVAESYDLRCILECAAAQKVTAAISDKEFEKLLTINERMITLLQQENYQAILSDYLDLDREFHRNFVQLAGNSRLSTVHAQINTHLHVARARIKFNKPDSQKTQNEHAGILLALKKRDVDAVCAAVEKHINLSKERTLQVMADE